MWADCSSKKRRSQGYTIPDTGGIEGGLVVHIIVCSWMPQEQREVFCMQKGYRQDSEDPCKYPQHWHAILTHPLTLQLLTFKIQMSKYPFWGGSLISSSLSQPSTQCGTCFLPATWLSDSPLDYSCLTWCGGLNEDGPCRSHAWILCLQFMELFGKDYVTGDGCAG